MDAKNARINKLLDWIEQSGRIVFLGGAGVSTDSGIPDFRSSTGLYGGSFGGKYGVLSVEQILSGEYFRRFPEKFYKFYFEHLVYPDAKPNIVHKALEKLERLGKLSAVVTQNIDGLHEKAGSGKVLCLHGSTASYTCVRCGSRYALDEIRHMEIPPICSCGGIVKPDVVLFGESLDQDVMYEAAKCISEADMLIAGGTSLVVTPAALFVQYFRGDRFVIINRDATPYDKFAHLVIREPLGEVFEAVDKLCGESK